MCPYQGAGYVQSGAVSDDEINYYGDSEVDFGNVKKGIEWANSVGYYGRLALPTKLIFEIMG